MKVKDMFTKDFAEKYGDIDVYDDVCEELGVAFCPPMYLTEEGQKMFALVLEDNVRIGQDVAVVEIDALPDGVWQKHLKVLKELFYGASGYCTVDEYEDWFKEG